MPGSEMVTRFGEVAITPLSQPLGTTSASRHHDDVRLERVGQLDHDRQLGSVESRRTLCLQLASCWTAAAGWSRSAGSVDDTSIHPTGLSGTVANVRARVTTVFCRSPELAAIARVLPRGVAKPTCS